MTGDEIRRAQFREARRGGYRADDVDSFLEHLAAAADRSDPLAPLVADAVFRAAKRGGYRTEDVDRLLEEVARSSR